METGLYPVKRYSTLAMLVMYLFMISVYLFYIPNRTLFQKAKISQPQRAVIHRDNNATNPSVQVHYSVKSLPETKRKTLFALSQTAAFVFFVLFAYGAFSKSKVRQAYNLALLAGCRQHSYLDLRVLRI